MKSLGLPIIKTSAFCLLVVIVKLKMTCLTCWILTGHTLKRHLTKYKGVFM